MFLLCLLKILFINLELSECLTQHVSALTNSEPKKHEGTARYNYYNETIDYGTTLKPNSMLLHTTDQRVDGRSLTGLSNDDIVNILHDRNFVVKNFSDGRPIALVGDVAYYAEMLIPEILPNEPDRATNIQKKKLWIDVSGNQQVWYYYDDTTKADHKIFEQAVDTWAKSSCIQFSKLASGGCQEDRGHGAICVGDFGGCFSHVGNSYSNGWTKHSQRMSVQPNGCEMVAAAHEFGHALGFQHEQSRPDVEKFMFVNYHNLDISLKGSLDQNTKQAWFQASRCTQDQVLNLPIPYDYLSIMQYGASDFANEDARIVYSVKDVHHQYMLDYHRNAGEAQTHYDKLVINTAYKCVDKWKKGCVALGKSPPKCKYNGFVTHKCKCACPPGFSGYNCGNKGPIYPILDRAKTMIDVNSPKTLDLTNQGMHLDPKNNHYILKSFINFQFITVLVTTGNKRLRPTIDVVQPFDKVAPALKSMRTQNFFMMNVGIADCEMSLFFYWGDPTTNKMRTECVSSLVNNEIKEDRPQWRSGDQTLGISAISFMGKMFNVPDLSMHAVELKMDVKFAVNPRLQLRVFNTPEDDPGPLADPLSSIRPFPIGAIIGIVIGVSAVLVLIGVFVAWKMGKFG